MRERGFGSHAAKGALFLGGVWFFLHLPRLAAALRQGGWPAWVAIAAVLVGALGGPIVLLLIEGDELFGCLGVVAALLAGWLGGRHAPVAGLSPGAVEAVRLCWAALGPLALYLGFHLIARLVDRRRRT